MANRSYLYASNQRPTGKPSAGRIITGLTEWNYEIPLVQRILVSGNPQTCFSSIWTVPADPSVVPEHMAIVGDAAPGLARLKTFFQRITLPEAQKFIGDALEFLGAPNRQLGYYFLEAAEVFDMEDEEIHVQNQRLCAALADIDAEIEEVLARLNAGGDESKGALRELGLDNWSHVLYHDISEPYEKG